MAVVTAVSLLTSIWPEDPATFPQFPTSLLDPLTATPARQVLQTAQQLCGLITTLQHINPATPIDTECRQLRRLLFLTMAVLVLPQWPGQHYELLARELRHLIFQPPFDAEGMVLGALVAVINGAAHGWATLDATDHASYVAFTQACQLDLEPLTVWPSLHTTLGAWQQQAVLNLIPS